jgi:hypothetical protein
MTSLRWDNVPKPRVERPPLLAPSSRSARWEKTLPNLKDRIEEVSGSRIELRDLARSTRAAARASSAKMRPDRCSVCKARGVTLWRVESRLVCASCRPARKWPTRDNPDIGQSRATGTLTERREL